MQRSLWLTVPGIVLGIFVLAAVSPAQQKAKETKAIADGSQVSLEYTLSDDEGKMIESNKGKEPLVYTHGNGQIIPGLEKQLLGMKVGGAKHVTVKPEDAYGPVNPKAFQEISKANVPPEALKVGATLMARSTQGQAFPVRVHEIKDKTVVMNFNHPLAGKTLAFDVKVLDIKIAESNPPGTKSPGAK